MGAIATPPRSEGVIYGRPPIDSVAGVRRVRRGVVWLAWSASRRSRRRALRAACRGRSGHCDAHSR